MFISKAQVQNLLKTYGKDNKNKNIQKTTEVKGAAKKDKIAISNESKTKQKAMQSIKKSDDLRQDKIDAAKQKISTGTYTKSNDEVAEKMIEQAIIDKLI
ncbi:hypothetical protein SYNTR_1843 [Candidatus Syntrophocurvum alkaliphilum]|uniref:Anti-sigma-28 factor FlgM C-terminal domain-containing protein n=1 Tax=Candidatus Syntrophocurvum alkaliphilum TaxID=2293317 RepID=A0A6I6DK62_9FIRM|nr:flagellar biosynthesis anti-sigma factor FlgM [Candidatus Syntrophocurvum alkaliphilum]QGU00437.1 hypothetical protein SYNTR_1843 [Candidatus Syntrophocurvum alkaliphilum]